MEDIEQSIKFCIEKYGIKYDENNLLETLHKVIKILNDTEYTLACFTKSKYSFLLTNEQENEFDAWKEKINDLMGSYGSYSFIFKPNAIGTEVIIHSDLINKDLDISHEEDW